MKRIILISMFAVSAITYASDRSQPGNDHFGSGGIIAKCGSSRDYLKSVLRLERGTQIKYLKNYEGFMKTELCEADARVFNESLDILNSEPNKTIVAKCGLNSDYSKSVLHLEESNRIQYLISFLPSEEHECKAIADAINETMNLKLK